jgi:hypothetical protein
MKVLQLSLMDKAGRRAAVFCLIIIPAFFLTGCEPQGITIMDRLSSFGADLNKTDRTGIQQNFSESETADYAAISSAAWWTANGFPVTTDEYFYSIVVAEYEDESNVTATMYGPPTFNNPGIPIMSAVFVMVKEGADYYIREAHLTGSAPIDID